MRLLSFITCWLLLLGCGATASATAGAPCGSANETQCAGPSALLACEKGAWKRYACPSCAGTTCDWKGATNGTECPEASAGDGWCPFDGRVLSCFWSASAGAGVFIESACASCVKDRSLRELGRCSGGTCTCQ